MAKFRLQDKNQTQFLFISLSFFHRGGLPKISLVYELESALILLSSLVSSPARKEQAPCPRTLNLSPVSLIGFDRSPVWLWTSHHGCGGAAELPAEVQGAAGAAEGNDEDDWGRKNSARLTVGKVREAFQGKPPGGCGPCFSALCSRRRPAETHPLHLSQPSGCLPSQATDTALTQQLRELVVAWKVNKAGNQDIPPVTGLVPREGGMNEKEWEHQRLLKRL